MSPKPLLTCLLVPFAVTPPGYKTVISGDTGATTECGPGEFRAEWAPAASASTCSVCGVNIDSSATEEITAYDVTSDATPRKVYVRAAASSCSEFLTSRLALVLCMSCMAGQLGLEGLSIRAQMQPCMQTAPGACAPMTTRTPTEPLVLAEHLHWGCCALQSLEDLKWQWGAPPGLVVENNLRSTPGALLTDLLRLPAACQHLLPSCLSYRHQARPGNVLQCCNWPLHGRQLQQQQLRGVQHHLRPCSVPLP